MMRLTLLIILLIGGILPKALHADLLPCEKLYAEAIVWFEAGKFDIAADLFSEAILLSPEPGSAPNSYTPYIYLAASQYELGNPRGARDALIQSLEYGLSAQSTAGRQLIGKYAVAIMSAQQVKQASTPELLSSPVAGQNRTLSNMNAEVVRARVLKRCALSTKIEENKLPWYFHYLLGLEFSGEGDNSRALESFQLGANIREESMRNKRLYGMWFLDYLPYYQIALTNARLGNWKHANNALYVSLYEGEFVPGEAGWIDFTKLENQIRQHSNH
jgi:tetratricopeptide (TPR) repeat protein